jgi:hypothetical protein
MLVFSCELSSLAGGADVHIVKKPDGLRNENPDPSHPHLTAKDRALWKSVLGWCNECEERATPYIKAYDERYGGILIYPIGENQYIVDINCYMTMRQNEHIFYKITEHNDTIESRLVILEQFYHADHGDDRVQNVSNPKGEFVRFTDSMIYGITLIPDKHAKVIMMKNEYSGMGNCGLYTVYDVSGDCPKVIEFRANLSCTADAPAEDKWKLYPPDQRAKWRTIPNNPHRWNWKSPSAPPGVAPESPAGPQFEKRCGWFDNPTPANIYLHDRDNTWIIGEQGLYYLDDEWEWPDFTPKQKVLINGHYGYGCVCMEVKVDQQTHKVLEIQNTRIQSLDVCRRDPGLKRWRPYFK